MSPNNIEHRTTASISSPSTTKRFTNNFAKQPEVISIVNSPPNSPTIYTDKPQYVFQPPPTKSPTPTFTQYFGPPASSSTTNRYTNISSSPKSKSPIISIPSSPPTHISIDSDEEMEDEDVRMITNTLSDEESDENITNFENPKLPSLSKQEFIEHLQNVLFPDYDLDFLKKMAEECYNLPNGLALACNRIMEIPNAPKRKK